MASITVLTASSTPAGILERDGAVQVELAENPTTGYRWTVTTEPEDLVDVERSDYDPPATDAPGAGGRRILILRLRHGGRAVVRLTLARPWEPLNPIDELVVAIEE